MPGTEQHSTAQIGDLPPYKSQGWYTAYIAALFEADRALMRERIKCAEHLIVLREQELLKHDPDVREQSSLNNALHALYALRRCLSL